MEEMTSNNIITLGSAKIEWRIAKGVYNCLCAEAEPLNPFDKAICGILYRNGAGMRKEDLAFLMGFNSINDAERNLYRDESEWAIFCAAVKSLEGYGLVEDSPWGLQLTVKGRYAVETGRKQKEETKQVVLWDDEYHCGSDISFFDRIQKEEYVISEDAPRDLLLDAETALSSQHPGLIDSSSGKSVASINEQEVHFYSLKVPFWLYYDFDTQELWAEPEYDDDMGALSSIVLENDAIQEKVNEIFFAEAQESIIFKPKFQLLLESEDEEKDIPLVCGLNEMFDYIRVNQDSDYFFLFFDLLNSGILKALKNVANSQSCKFICVEYKQIEEGLIVESEKNLCFIQCQTLRTDDVCVCSPEMYFKREKIVVSHDDVDYEIPVLMLVQENEPKYRMEQVKAPFIPIVADKMTLYANQKADIVLAHPSADSIRELLLIKRLIDDFCGNQETKYDFLDSKIENIIGQWSDKVQESIDELSSSIISGLPPVEASIKLKAIRESVEYICEEEFIAQINELEARVKTNKPKQVKQVAYIVDASAFMDMPDLLTKFSFTHDRVFIPRAMQQELDGLSHDAEKGETARMALRNIRRQKADRPRMIQIYEEVNLNLLPETFDVSIKDNQMLAIAIELVEQCKYKKVIILTNDEIFVDTVIDYINHRNMGDAMETINIDEFILRKREDS